MKARSVALLGSLALWGWSGAASGAPTPGEIDVEEHLGQVIDGSLPFADESGRAVTLSQYLGRGPVMVVPAYYRCPVLCGLVLRGAALGLRDVGLRPGADYRVLTISIDSADTPARATEKRASAVRALGDESVDWPFLTGPTASIAALTGELGLRFTKDPVTGEIAHPAAIAVLTPEGRISRYLYGVEFPSSDLRLALVEAGRGRVGTLVDRVILTCYRFDPATRRYGPFLAGFLRIGGLVIATMTAGLLVFMALWERRRRVSREAAR